MKNVFFILGVACAIASCNSKSEWNEKTEADYKRLAKTILVAQGEEEDYAIKLAECHLEKLKAAKLGPDDWKKKENKIVVKKLADQCDEELNTGE